MEKMREYFVEDLDEGQEAVALTIPCLAEGVMSDIHEPIFF